MITELQATVRVPADEAQRSSRQTIHLFNVNARLALTERPFLYYEFDTYVTQTDDRTTWLASSGLSLNHSFNEVYSVNSRLTRENGQTVSGEREATIFSAALDVRSLDKLRNRVIVNAMPRARDKRLANVLENLPDDLTLGALPPVPRIRQLTSTI